MWYTNGCGINSNDSIQCISICGASEKNNLFRIRSSYESRLKLYLLQIENIFLKPDDRSNDNSIYANF